MKKILIALALMGITCSGALAQDKCKCPNKTKTKTVAHVNHHPLHNTSQAKTYQVCREQGGYYTCCLYRKAASKSW